MCRKIELLEQQVTEWNFRIAFLFLWLIESRYLNRTSLGFLVFIGTDAHLITVLKPTSFIHFVCFLIFKVTRRQRFFSGLIVRKKSVSDSWNVQTFNWSLRLITNITRFPKSNFVFETSFAFCVTSLLHLLLPVWSLGPTTRKSPFSQQSIRVEKAGVTFWVDNQAKNRGR